MVCEKAYTRLARIFDMLEMKATIESSILSFCENTAIENMVPGCEIVANGKMSSLFLYFHISQQLYYHLAILCK